MIRRPPRSTLDRSSAASDVYKRQVVDGPFAETKELIAGFWILQTKTREECVEWMKRAPFEPGSTLEIRQIAEAEDFAAIDPSGEIRDQEKRLRDTLASR